MASKLSASFLQLSRKVHLYFGLFISPALLFFAFTGCYQTLGLHEAAGSSYKPPAILASLGQIHKKQTYVLPVRKGPGPEGGRVPGEGGGRREDENRATRGSQTGAGDGARRTADSPARAQGQDGPPAAGRPAASPEAGRPTTLWAKQKQHLPLKIFFVIVSLGLFTSTLTGIYMAYRYDRNKALVTGLLVLGVVLPLVLVNF